MSYKVFKQDVLSLDLTSKKCRSALEAHCSLAKLAKKENDLYSFVIKGNNPHALFVHGCNFYHNVIPNSFVKTMFPNGCEVVFSYNDEMNVIGNIDAFNMSDSSVIGEALICGERLSYGFKGLRYFELIEFLLNINVEKDCPSVIIQCILPIKDIFED
ncbi:MAG: hypothetical protein IGS23_14020 [Rivularia sp. T60_A2020_040]|nr:hypothetical protein [Rivularia sp. T60_A2020_040]